MIHPVQLIYVFMHAYGMITTYNNVILSSIKSSKLGYVQLWSFTIPVYYILQKDVNSNVTLIHLHRYPHGTP